jgi:hypothetical protein
MGLSNIISLYGGTLILLAFLFMAANYTGGPCHATIERLHMEKHASYHKLASLLLQLKKINGHERFLFISIYLCRFI